MELQETTQPPVVDIDRDAKAMLEYFNGNLPQGGESMIGVLHYCQEHLSHAEREWKVIYERANKMQRDANAQLRTANAH